MKNKAELPSRLHQHKVNALLSMTPVAISAGLVGAVIIFAFYWYTPARPLVSAWFGIYLLLYFFRYAVVRMFNNNPAGKISHNHILKFHILTSVLAGLLWSAVCIYLLNVFDIHEAFYAILILGGLLAGVLSTNIMFMSTYFAFTLPAAVPVILFALVNENPQLGAFAIVLSIFVVFITSGAFRLNKLVSESITYHFENLQLLEQLEQEKNQVSKLYSNLEYDLASRKEAEKKLKIEKQRAEELADSLIAISTLDGLTGIPNRRHLDSTLAKEWNRASRGSTPISLVMCDIDYFKAYNDHYGHQKGDNCLIQIAEVLNDHARRDDDMAARYGGEEFAIILPTTSLENAKELAEQMRLAIVELCIRHRYSETDNIVTASFGVATMVPQREQPSKYLVSRADKALYMAKQQGRNRVVDIPLEMHDDNFDQQEGNARA